MSQRNSGYSRQADDVYETPPWVTRVIAGYLRGHRRKIWDPANGPASKMAQVLRAEGLDAIATNDDFLIKTCLPHSHIDAICTNPPYGSGGRLACQFIAHALDLVPVVAMLLRIDFDSGKTRTPLFRDCPTFAQKVVLLDRIMWFPGDVGPSTNHAWFVWNKWHRGPATISYGGADR